MVIIELVDFISAYSMSSSPSTEHGITTFEEISHLINLLKKTISSPVHKQFSLNFLRIGDFDWMSSSSGYDIIISEQYDKLIASSGSLMKVFDRPKHWSDNNQDFEDDQLFQVSYGHNHAFRCMKLIKENDEEFIYTTDRDYMVVKIRVSDLMNRQATLVWKSQSVSASNVWGLDILNGRVYVLDYGTGFKVFDCTNGDEIIGGDSSTVQQQERLPTISRGFGVHFFSEKEMLISHAQQLELFEKENEQCGGGEWKSIRKTSFLMEDAYSIFYEEVSDMIYIADSGGGTINVVRKDNFEQIVKSTGDFYNNFGMIVDRKSGLLYVCDSCGIVVFQ